MGNKTLSIFTGNNTNYCYAWVFLSWETLSSVSAEFHYTYGGTGKPTGWRIRSSDKSQIWNGEAVKDNTITVSLVSGREYFFQIYVNNGTGWTNNPGPESFQDYFNDGKDPKFSLTESSGPSTPSQDSKTNTISFSSSSYQFGSTGGEIEYTRSTTGTGKAPVLYVDSTEVESLGDDISSGSSVTESFSTKDYEEYFTVGKKHTIELRVAEHTSSSTITSSASASATVEIYNRPSQPQISQKIVASSSTRDYINTPVYDDDSTLKFSENNVNWYVYNGSNLFEKDKDYYFKATHDITEEDSTILKIAPIVSNIAKKIEFEKVDYIEETSKNLLSTEIVYARKVMPTVVTDAQSYLWYFRSSKTQDKLSESEAKLITTSTEKTIELTINDSALKREYYYNIGVSGRDNYGDTSEINWYSKTFQIAKKPEISEIKNHFISDESFDNDLVDSDRFYTNLTLYFSYDSEITQNNIYCQYREKNDSTSIWNKAYPKEESFSLGSIEKDGYIMVQLPSTLTSDKEYQFRLCFTFLNTEVYTEAKDRMYQINKSNIVNNLTVYGNQEIFKPYTETGTLELQITKPYGNSFKENYTSYEKFQCQIIIDKKPILLDMLETGGFIENSDDTVSFFFNKANLYDKLEPLKLNQASSHKAILKLAVDNVFGLSHSENLNIIIDYKENPVITFNQPKYANETSLDSDSIIKENDIIIFNFSFSDYNKETFRSCIQINRSDSSIPDGQWIDYNKETMHSPAEEQKSGYLTPIKYTSAIEMEIPEITLPKYIFFRVRVTDSSGDKYSDYYSCGRSLQHTTPVIQQLNVTYKEEGNSARSGNSIVTGQLSLVDLGIGLKGVSSLDLINDEDSVLTFQSTFSADGKGMTEISNVSYSFKELIENSGQNKNLTFILPFDFEGQDVNYATLQIRARTKISYSIDDPSSDETFELFSDKTFELSPFIVFNTLQTVSYRKNRLAINVRDFDTNPEYEKAILVIGQADSSKNQIIYSTPNGSGHLINFVIDCGTWS